MACSAQVATSAQAAAALDAPCQWAVKGEGNANVVFEYRGQQRHLIGRVLRVRKARPPLPDQEEQLEQVVWAPALGAAARSGPAARQAAYVDAVLAPLLGRQHLPSQEGVSLSHQFLEGLCTASGRSPGSLDAACAVLMPDVTLLPTAEPPKTAAAAPPAAAADSDARAGQSVLQPPGLQGAVLCVELKPKCGFVGGACPTVHPRNRGVKRSASRYQLHQALKMAQGKVQRPSSYDPADLFAEGELARLQHALLQLLLHPQNNLALFEGGRPLALPAAGGQPAAHEADSDGVGTGASSSGGSTDAEEQSNLSWVAQAAGGLLAPLPAAERPAALTRLLAGVLSQEGVLPRLLGAQRACSYDVEGVYRLYCKLSGRQVEAPQPGESGLGGSDAPESAAGAVPMGTSTQDQPESCRDAAACFHDDSAQEDPGDELAAHVAAVARLLALPRKQALALLRNYAVAATAKDCALMISLQRLTASQPGGGSSSLPAPRPQQQAGSAGGAGEEAAGTFVPGVVVDGTSGLACAYSLFVVDLDLKPLSKIPVHYELDQQIVAAVLQQRERARREQEQAPQPTTAAQDDQ